MAKIDKEHQVFIQLTEDQNYMKFVRENAPIYSRQLKEDITKNKAVINKKVASFVK